MTELVRSAPGPLPLARKGEASPAVSREARGGPQLPRTSMQHLPATDLPAANPAERDRLATLASLIRHVPHRGSAQPANPPAPALSSTSPWSAAPNSAAVVLHAERAEASRQQEAGPGVHRMPPAPTASHVALQIDIHRRRQLTLRLTIAEFARLHDFARRTRSTYQDILATAVRLFLDTIERQSEAAEDKPAPQPASDPHRAHLRLLP